MTKPHPVEMARRFFARITGELEDTTLISAEAQAAPSIAAARETCDDLSVRLKACLDQLQRLRRRLE
jgi:uncharacterized damage-inducible protein DinB